MRWPALAILPLVGLAFAAHHALGPEPAEACGSAGPFDFDTHERANYTSDYALAIELAVAGAVVDSPFVIAGETVDLTYQGVESGPRGARTSANRGVRIPPTLYKSIVWIESNWANAAGTVPYGGVGPTLRSFDCGYGLGQITSGMGNDSGVATAKQAAVGAHPLFNLAEGVRILASKWNTAPELRPVAGAGDPGAYEDWYYAVWAYNGFWIGNHPLNPLFDPLRGGNETSPLYHCYEPKAHSYQDDGTGFPKFGYGDYTYQERVYGCMKYPPNYSPPVEASGLAPSVPAVATPEPGARAQLVAGLGPGVTAKVTTGGDCLRLRAQPSTSASQIGCLPDGTLVTIVSGPVAANNFDWWEADTPAGRGWLADAFLAVADSTPPPTPTPVAPPVPLPPPVLDGPRLWQPAVFRMPEFSHPLIAAAFAPANFSTCEAGSFSGGCANMDFPTLIPEWEIAPHGDGTPAVDPSRRQYLFGSPQLAVSGPRVIVASVDPEIATADTIDVANTGTGTAPFRVTASHPWIHVRHASDNQSRSLDGGVAVGSDIEVVLTRDPRRTQQGYTSKLKIGVDLATAPKGVTNGSVVIEPLFAGSPTVVLSVVAWNQDEPPARPFTIGLPFVRRD